ncbi:GFA family protein [Asticcacaulis sp. 201]|uniref:GFA family protein n=1 Tax=Asticcacaulis sp. 201 TaxID=3028787 RepID=UPI002916092D|nr:GFA family protein [Asticcacaulis sp. 201]MDV6330424.1 GFA family protein [Asticcacaulis sp. 201]
MMTQILKGGCQCGAIRFEVTGPLTDTSICHCRMCQKAFGNFFAPLVSVRGTDFRWTRVEPARFQSSNLVQRGFCPACGTPLTYEAPDGMAVAIGAFDHPENLEPTIQYGIEGRLAYLDRLNDWSRRTTLDDIEAAPFLDKLVSYQYPDEA